MHLYAILILIFGRYMTPQDVYNRERVIDLLVRYWGLGKPLDQIEKERLLVALDDENKAMAGPIHVRALERLAAKGIT
jgi:hypothetical protein